MAELFVQTRNRQGNSLCICLLYIRGSERISNHGNTFRMLVFKTKLQFSGLTNNIENSLSCFHHHFSKGV